MNLDAFFNKHKGARRLLLLWAMCLISWVVVHVVSKVTEINGHVAAIVIAVIGILATVIGFYQWSRSNDG